MPWKATDPMTERRQGMAAYLTQMDSMTELCERFGSRRNTGAQWGRRSAEPGLAGLQEQSHAPPRGPHRMSEEVAAGRVAAKPARPPWGPRKILPYLARHHPDLPLPAPSTAGTRFPRAGFSHACHRRRRHRHPGARPRQAEAPHAVWTADVKGPFRTGDGRSCDPLTVADAYRRLLFSCSARLATKQVDTRPLFARLVREYGLPDASRPAHGTPFAPPALCSRRMLSVWWRTLGLRHPRIAPGRPEQQGRHERLHRTLKADAPRPPAPHQRAPPARCDRFRRAYNEARPHDALPCRPPASRYQPSARPMPAKRPAPTDPGHALGRRVSHAGTLRCQTRQLWMRDTLLQEDSAWEETADGLWAIDFYDVLLARLAERDFKLDTCKSVIEVAGLYGHRCCRLLHEPSLASSKPRHRTRRIGAVHTP